MASPARTQGPLSRARSLHGSLPHARPWTLGIGAARTRRPWDGPGSALKHHWCNEAWGGLDTPQLPLGAQDTRPCPRC